MEAVRRYAVVTGANRGMGLEIVRQLASSGLTVVLTARDEKSGTEAVSSLHKEGLSNVAFHQLDVTNSQSIERLSNYLKSQYGRLDILVNNAAYHGGVFDESLKAMNINPADCIMGKVRVNRNPFQTTYESAKECFAINYYGVKNLTETLIPLLEQSPSGARVVNVSSVVGVLRRVPNMRRRRTLGDIDNLTEEKIEEILNEFLRDVRANALNPNEWEMTTPAYSISKAALNAYTRLLARAHPNMYINCVHPGYVKTDFNWQTGVLTPAQGARSPVTVALLPPGGPTGRYFDQTYVSEF